MPEAGHGTYDEIFLEPVGLIGMDGQKSGGESKEDSLPFGMVRVAGFRMPQVERRKEWYAFCAFLVCLLIGTNDFFMQHLDSVPVFP